MSKLNLFKESVPHNWKFLHNPDDIDEIIIGGSVTHVFELPFNYNKVAKSAVINYKQGLEVKLSLQIQPSMVHVMGNNSVIYVYLPPIYTEVFDETVLDTYCQLEVFQYDNQVLYDEKHKLKVIKPIASNHIIAPIQDVVVNGKSIVDGGVAVIPQFTVDFSEDCLFRLYKQEFEGLIEDHCLILNEDRLYINPELLTHDGDVIVSVDFGNRLETVKLVRNGKANFMGELILNNYSDVYEITISLLTNTDETIAVIRSANLN